MRERREEIEKRGRNRESDRRGRTIDDGYRSTKCRRTRKGLFGSRQ